MTVRVCPWAACVCVRRCVGAARRASERPLVAATSGYEAAEEEAPAAAAAAGPVLLLLLPRLTQTHNVSLTAERRRTSQLSEPFRNVRCLATQVGCRRGLARDVTT